MPARQLHGPIGRVRRLGDTAGQGNELRLLTTKKIGRFRKMRPSKLLRVSKLEEKYILNLQKQIVLMEHEIKLLKDREVD